MPGRIAVGLGILVLLAGGAGAAFVMVMAPAELVRSELIRQVKNNTGRELAIDGEARLVFYPDIGVSLGNVSLSAPAGMGGKPLLTAETIDVSVALLPLVSREVKVRQVSLVRPVIDLHVDAKGRRSWDFAAWTRRRVRLAGLGAGLDGFDKGHGVASDAVRVALPAAGAPGHELLDKLELRSVRLTGAVIRYRDARSGTFEQIDGLDLKLNGKRLTDPLKARGRLTWQNEPVEFDARLDTPSALLAEREAKARVTLAGRPASAGFEGTVKLAPALEVTGQTRIGGDSLAGAARWFGIMLPNAAPLGGFQVSGRMVGNAKSVTLGNATMNLGKTRAAGVVLVEMRARRPYLSADLKVSDLDIDHLAAGFAGARTTAQPQSPAAGERRTAASPKSIEDLLRRSQAHGAGRFAPQVRGYANRNAWSSEHIDASALGVIDAKARLRIEKLKVAGLGIDSTSVRLALADRAARADIDAIQLYGGSGKGVVTVKPSGKGLGFGANLNIGKVAARAFLKDAADFDRIDGHGDLEVIVSGAGDSQKVIAGSLNGTARFIFRDGAIVGWNIAKIIRGLQQGQVSNFDAVASEKTDFSELGGSFQIAAGTATTGDLRMISPLLRLAGQGDVGIAARNLNLGLRPKLVSSLRGQGGRGDVGGLEIPVKLKGPWHDPRIVPDFKGLTKDPRQLFDQAEKFGKQFKGRNLGDIVRGVLGDGQNENRAGEEEADRAKPSELFKKLFR